MLNIKCYINQQDLKTVDLHFAKLNFFHSLEVVDRVSETQLQVGENYNKIIWRWLKGNIPQELHTKVNARTTTTF